MTLEEYRKEFQNFIDEYKEARCDEFGMPTQPFPTSPSAGMRGACIGVLNKIVGNDNRKQFLKALTGFSSSKDLKDEEWYALVQWLQFGNVANEWCVGYGKAEAVKSVIAQAMPAQEKLL